MPAYLSQGLVDIVVVLIEALGKLIVLIDKVADVDAAEWVDLRERQGKGEALAVRWSNAYSVVLESANLRKAASDQSPSAGIQLTDATLSNSSVSLTTMACESSSVTICAIPLRMAATPRRSAYLLEAARDLGDEQACILLEQGRQQLGDLRRRIIPALREPRIIGSHGWQLSAPRWSE
jgi:hypothetical protein